MKAYVLRPGAPQLEGECPLCGNHINPPDSVVECPDCKTFYHLDCWRFCHNRCVRFGCSGQSDITGVIPAPSSLGKLDRALSTMRIKPAEIARAVGQGTRASEAAISWIWQGPIRSVFFSVLLSLLASLLYTVVTSFLRSAMGEEIFAGSFGLPSLSGVGEWASSHWLLGGILYGIWYYRHLTFREGGFQRFLRVLLSGLYFCPLCFELGHLLFTPGRLAPGLLWGLATKVLWLAPIVAWLAFLAAALCLIGSAAERVSVYLFTAAFVFFLIGLGIPAYINLVTFGLFAGGLFWLAGSAVDLVWHGHHLGALFGSWGLAIGGSIGFITGGMSVLQKMGTNSSSSQ